MRKQLLIQEQITVIRSVSVRNQFAEAGFATPQKLSGACGVVHKTQRYQFFILLVARLQYNTKRSQQ